ncbi:MAG: outer membrane beta-barrel protein [Bacteroidetes bacterium]|nr:outer membrane beta-barrel protein [Bacteroidota bacterium]
MNNISSLLATVLLSIVLVVVPMRAADGGSPEGLKIGATFGVATPSDKIADVYDFNNSVSGMYSDASAIGMSLGARFRYGMTEHLSFCGGIAYNRFNNSAQTATISGTGQTFVVNTATNIIPIHAGFDYFLLSSLIRPYVGAELMYTYTSTTLLSSTDESILTSVLVPGQELEPKVSRFGAGLSAGLELNLGGLAPFFEVKYVMSNLVGKTTGEPERNFLNVTLGLMF